MKIYTSYFAVESKIPKNITRISIARSTPKGLICLEYNKLVPTAKILTDYKSGKITEEQYAKSYRKNVLNKLTLEEVLKYFDSAGNGFDVVLLCYEKSTSFCHRHLVAEWFIEQGIMVDEYPIPQ